MPVNRMVKVPLLMVNELAGVVGPLSQVTLWLEAPVQLNFTKPPWLIVGPAGVNELSAIVIVVTVKPESVNAIGDPVRLALAVSVFTPETAPSVGVRDAIPDALLIAEAAGREPPPAPSAQFTVNPDLGFP